ncbi:MAG: inositol monophosphatase [Aquificaceae bacterium]|nr:inositol monophosphatase [Aquificaceae bacterium]MDW8237150.1 inositol monophosphatase [Aquificaceae bacterium]
MLEDALKVAREACVLGGLVLKDHFGKIEQSQILSKGEKDVFCIADRESEERIREHIARHFPDHAIVGEEGGGNEDGDFVWYIDPLDGTKNFLMGLPMFGVSVGLFNLGEPIVGAVYLPAFDSLYWAKRGSGAFKNGKALRVNPKSQINRCSVVYGFPSRAKRDLDNYLKIIKEVFIAVGSMRRPGAASVDLCLLAEGVFDCFMEFELRPWDVAAGLSIASEAGANIWLPGGFSSSLDLCVGYGPCFDFIKAVVEKHIC